MAAYERGENPAIDKMVDDAVMKLITDVNGTMLREPLSILVTSTASVDPAVINQRGNYRWRDSDERAPVLMSTGSMPSEYTMAGEYERMRTASESKEPPKVEDLPPVFKREIDL